jgi:hypothetical protein
MLKPFPSNKWRVVVRRHRRRRKNLVHLLNHDFDYVLILSGDRYRMDFGS